MAKRHKWKGFRTQQQLSNQPVAQHHPSVAELTIRQESGPLPPPDTLAQYERISPGFADRIVSMAEKEQVNRHGQEGDRWALQDRLLTRGQIFAFILSLAIVFGGIWLLTMDKPITGFVTILGAIGTVAGPFIYQMRWKRQQAQQGKK